jgi:hypothetical protein
VSVDEQTVLRKDLLPYGPEDQYNPLAYYQEYPIDVPAGSHRIRVANTGGGTILTAFQLTNYVRRFGPNLVVRGMQTEDYLLLWLQNPDFNWLYSRMGKQPDRQPAGRLVLRDVPKGTWIVEWIDTVEAGYIGHETVTSRDAGLVLETPATAKSVAARLQRIGRE